jgi:hypothetical protein
MMGQERGCMCFAWQGARLRTARVSARAVALQGLHLALVLQQHVLHVGRALLAVGRVPV